MSATKKSTKADFSVILLKWLPWILIVFGTLGIIASFTLTYDKIKVMQDATYVPNCNINPVLSCGSVMKTKQAEIMGVPSTIFGLIGYTAVVVVGAALLAKARFERWFWLSLQLGVTAAFAFIHYLFFQGVFRIGAVCPFCFLTWISTAPLFWYVTVYNVSAGHIRFAPKLAWLKRFILAHHLDLFILWYLLLLGTLLQHFWYYWKTLI